MKKRFTKILVANRGEIALRILRTTREMGIGTVVVYSVQDKNATFVRLADEAYPLPGEQLEETYLNGPEIIRIAKNTGCDAIHPGYGFLSENATFAAEVTQAGMIFIGPAAEVIRLMGNKIRAREWAAGLGIPVIPAVTGSDPEQLLEATGEIAFPMMIKAANGGGGKGMHIVHNQEQLSLSIRQAAIESLRYFGSDTLYIEQYLPSCRHIEVQLLADLAGNVMILSDRECSVQRRHQKIIEEAPAPQLSEKLRSTIAGIARKIAEASAYVNAGTIEFLLDDRDQVYFLEMNTRLQVEHPVTEMITGTDLVREQIRIAEGEFINAALQNVPLKGHAIEARIYAENPLSGFLPSPGNIHLYAPANIPGLRIDSAIDGPETIHPSYDPLICKLIAHGSTRNEAISTLQKSVSTLVIHGVKTNQAFISALLSEAYFRDATVTTGTVESLGEKKLATMHAFTPEEMNAVIIGFAIYTSLPHKLSIRSQLPKDLWRNTGYWRHVRAFSIHTGPHTFHTEVLEVLNEHVTIRLNNKLFRIRINHREGHRLSIEVENESYDLSLSVDPEQQGWVTLKGRTLRLRRDDVLGKVNTAPVRVSHNGNEVLTAPMTGKVISLNIKEKEKVKRGQPLLIIEAMKMQNTLVSPDNGIIRQIWARPGTLVQGNEPLLELEHYQS